MALCYIARTIFCWRSILTIALSVCVYRSEIKRDIGRTI